MLPALCSQGLTLLGSRRISLSPMDVTCFMLGIFCLLLSNTYTGLQVQSQRTVSSLYSPADLFSCTPRDTDGMKVGTSIPFLGTRAPTKPLPTGSLISEVPSMYT